MLLTCRRVIVDAMLKNCRLSCSVADHTGTSFSGLAPDIRVQCTKRLNLKGQCHKIYDPFFSEELKHFSNFSVFAKMFVANIRNSCVRVVNDYADTEFLPLLTPYFQIFKILPFVN